MDHSNAITLNKKREKPFLKAIARPLMMGMVATGAAFGALTLFSAAAFAGSNQGVSGFVFAGPAMAPDYEGGDDYELVPGFVGYADYDGLSVLVTPGDLDVDLLKDPRFNFGPSLSYRFERDDVENDQVDLLDNVDQAFELGANAAMNFYSLATEGDSFTVGLRLTQDAADGHGGFVARTSANYTYPISERLQISGGLEATAVSSDYADAYFGVDAANAARSGLSQSDADGGLKDVKLTVMVNYALTESWGVGAYVAYSRLLGDFADSSIVDEAGSPNQLFGMIGVQYRF